VGLGIAVKLIERGTPSLRESGRGPVRGRWETRSWAVMAPLRARAGYFRLYGAGRTTVLPSIVTAPATSAAPASALPFTTVPLT